MRPLIEFTVNKIDRYVLMYLVAIVVLPRISTFSLYRASGFIGGLLGVNQGECFGSFQTEKLPGSGFGMRLVWKEARFPPKIWSVYDRVINQDHRTNNFLEHPDIYKFLSKLTGEQAHTEISRREILRGEDPSCS